MKIRTDFVTNSSSSQFILKLNRMNKDIAAQVKEMMLNPLPYEEEFCQWLMSEKPIYEKDNPNRIPMYLPKSKAEKKKLRAEWEKEGVDKGLIDHRLKYFTSDKINPEYEALPEVVRDMHEWIFSEDALDWDIRETPEGDMDLCTSMDNFDYMMYSQFCYEKITGEKFNRNPDQSSPDLEYLGKYIDDIDSGHEYAIYDEENKRFKWPKLEISRPRSLENEAVE